MLRYWLAHRAWTANNRRAARRYGAALVKPRQAQERILHRCLRRNADSDYGQRYRFDQIRSVDEYRQRVPVVSYEDLEPWIERVCAGESGVLTRDPVRMVEMTSGSSGAAKFIPYTASLLREFRQGVSAWLYDLFARRPRLWRGPQYWSLTPVHRKLTHTEGGVPVGFEQDTEYFDGWDRWLLSQVIATPERAASCADLEECLDLTVASLLECPTLRFISVWCPSFLTLLADRLPVGLEPRDVWPDLGLISCWTSGESRRWLPEIQRRFPGVEIQGKGLLATEGLVSIPWEGVGQAPAVTSHFLEFLDGGRSFLVDELEVGATYTVVLTTGGGLYRYRLGDQVRVVEAVDPGRAAAGQFGLEFVGREGVVSDLCGEKLSESFVGSVLDAATRRFSIVGAPLLSPEWGAPPRYVLFVDSPQASDVGRFVEERLRESHHYDYCRELGQLAELVVCPIDDMARQYARACERSGQRVGDVKPTCLRTELDWRERLLTHAGS